MIITGDFLDNGNKLKLQIRESSSNTENPYEPDEFIGYDFDSKIKINMYSQRFKRIADIVYQLTDVLDFDLYEAVFDDALGRDYVWWEEEPPSYDEIPYIYEGDLQDIVCDYANVDITKIH